MNETLLTIVLVYVVIGMVNLILAFDQKVLMIYNELTIDSVMEAVFFVLLWPLQLIWYVLVQLSRLAERFYKLLGG